MEIFLFTKNQIFFNLKINKEILIQIKVKDVKAILVGKMGNKGELFELLDKFCHKNGFNALNLYEHQKDAIKIILEENSLLLNAPTASGKSIPLHTCMGQTLETHDVGLYLGPTTMLVHQKAKELEDYFGDKICIKKLWGESKITREEIRKAEKKLVFVATYEAFRSFLFSVQNRSYFKKQKVFKWVVVDEAHMIGDESRGAALESMLYKLQDEHDSKFLFLSATFNKKSAKYWARRFNSELIWLPSRRRFNYEIRTKESDNFNHKMEHIDEICEEWISEHHDVEEDIVTPGKMLIFSYSRKDAEEIAQRLNERFQDDSKGMQTNWSCTFVHAGLEMSERVNIFQRYERKKGLQILCCSPLLEAGVDVKDIEVIIIADTERYSMIKLTQMIGRCRGEEGLIIHLINEEKREKFEDSIVVDEEEPDILQGYELEEVQSQFDRSYISRIILERLYRSQPKISELKAYLENILDQSTFDDYMVRFDHAIDELINYFQFIRPSGGRLGLTYKGKAVVESQLDVYKALTFFDFIEKDENVWSRVCQNKIAEEASYMIINRDDYKDSDENYIQRKRGEIVCFLKKYCDKIEKNAKLIEYQGILHGDAEIYRRTAIWLSSSLYLLYRGHVFHEKAARESNEKYYQQDFSNVIKNKRKYFRRIGRLIKKFQKYPDERRYDKPKIRPHHVYIPTSQYKDAIFHSLKRFGHRGATIKELVDDINSKNWVLNQLLSISPLGENKVDVEKLNSLKNIGFPLPGPAKESTIRAVLRNSLAKQVFREYINLNKRGRPHFRYFLKDEIPKDIKNRCRDCKLFKDDPSKKKSEYSSKYNCEKGVLDSFPLREACDDFQLRINKIIPIHKFDTVNSQIKCPGCGKLNSLKIPEHGELSICKECKILIKRVKKARFVGKIGVTIPKDRIIVNKMNGFLTVKIFKYKRSILLTKNQELNLVSDLDLKLHILVEHTTNRAYFGDEVWNILLAGGKVSSDAKRYLKSRKIEIIEFTDEMISELENREEIAEEYRKLISSLRKRGKLDEIGRENIFAKIMSNIVDTEELGRNKLDKTLARKLVLEQLDWVVSSYLAPPTERKKRRGRKSNPHKNLNRLRSIEGNAEKAAWHGQKYSLPRSFKVLERQESRHAPSDLFTGVRAHDPYNAGLNKLYFLLARHGSNSLEKGGLSKYAPGPGIIHYRVQKYKRRKKKQVDFFSSFNKKNRELLYDFIDAYRPPLRHHFGMYIRKEKILATDFFWQNDEWGRRVYMPKKSGNLRLENLFNDVFSKKYYYNGRYYYDPNKLEKHALNEIMDWEAKNLAAYLKDTSKKYVPFVAFSDKKSMVRILRNFTVIDSILGGESRFDYISPKPIKYPYEELKTKRNPLKLLWEIIVAFTEEYIKLPKNIVIVVHDDFDGFGCALLLTLMHKNESNLNIILAEYGPESYKYLDRVLEEKIPPLLLEKGRNILYVADIPIEKDKKDQISSLFTRLSQKYKFFDCTWFDHHSPLIQDAEEFTKKNKIIFHHNEKVSFAFQIIHGYINRENIKILDKNRPDLIDIFNGLQESQQAPKFLDDWFDLFKFHKNYPYFRISWSLFFKKILRQKEPKKHKTFKRFFKKTQELIKSSEKLLYTFQQGKIQEYTFVLMVFRQYFDKNNLDLLLQGFSFDIKFCYWHNHTLSIYAKESTNINLKSFFGITGHPKAVTVLPTRIIYQFKKKKPKQETIEIDVSEAKDTVWLDEGKRYSFNDIREDFLVEIEEEKKGMKDEEINWFYYNFFSLDEILALFKRMDFSKDQKNQKFINYLDGIKQIELPFEKKRKIAKLKSSSAIDCGIKKDLIEKSFFYEIEPSKPSFLKLFIKELDDTLGGGFAAGSVNLVFSHKNRREILYNFINYLMLIPQLKGGYNSPKIICIDTLRLNYYNNLFKLSTSIKDFNLNKIKNIYFVKISNFEQLEHVLEELESIINLTKAKLVVINSFFLYLKRTSPKIQGKTIRQRIKWKMYENRKASLHLKKLKNLARRTGTCIILTTLNDHINEDAILPKISYPAIPLLDSRIYLDMIEKKHNSFKIKAEVHCQIKEDTQINFNLDTGNQEKLKLKDFSNLEPIKIPSKLEIIKELPSQEEIEEIEQIEEIKLKDLEKKHDTQEYCKWGETRFGNKFILSRFKGYITSMEVQGLLEEYEEERDIDICLWYNMNVSFYNRNTEEIDLGTIYAILLNDNRVKYNNETLFLKKNEYINEEDENLYESFDDFFENFLELNLKGRIYEFQERINFLEEFSREFFDKVEVREKIKKLEGAEKNRLISQFIKLFEIDYFYVEDIKPIWSNLLSKLLSHFDLNNAREVVEIMLENLANLDVDEEGFPLRADISNSIFKVLNS